MNRNTNRPEVGILAGFGLNCEDETHFAFASVGARPALVPVTRFLRDPAAVLRGCRIFVVPGGFSFGDDTGAGNGLARLLEAHAGGALKAFVAAGGLVLGICNGCQVLVRLGLVGGGARARLAVAENASGRYEARPVRLAVCREGTARGSPWFGDETQLDLPVAHGEGRFVGAPETWNALLRDGRVALRYATGAGAPAEGAYPANPNGSACDAAGVLDASGRVLALMPHPERAFLFHHRPDWPREAERLRRAGLQLPVHADGRALFAHAVAHAAAHPPADFG